MSVEAVDSPGTHHARIPAFNCIPGILLDQPQPDPAADKAPPSPPSDMFEKSDTGTSVAALVSDNDHDLVKLSSNPLYPKSRPTTPPTSPRKGELSPHEIEPPKQQRQTYLYPADTFKQLHYDPCVYGISAQQLHEARIDEASRPLPDGDKLFPYLHGLNKRNSAQCGYFGACRETCLTEMPSGIDGLLIVHFGPSSGNRIKGAVDPEEVLPSRLRRPLPSANPNDSLFVDADPGRGICLRNFQIQTSKWARLSDIIIYASDDASSCCHPTSPYQPNHSIMDFAKRVSHAQEQLFQVHQKELPNARRFNTFVLTEPFHNICRDCLQNGIGTGRETPPQSKLGDMARTIHFLNTECYEMSCNSRSSEILDNVYLGNTGDATRAGFLKSFDICVDCTGADRSKHFLPTEQAFRRAENQLVRKRGAVLLSLPPCGRIDFADEQGKGRSVHAITSLCEFLYTQAQSENSLEKSFICGAHGPRRILFYCVDGYSESTFYALCLLIFALGIRMDEAWKRLHTELGRDFYASTTEKRLIFEHLERDLIYQGELCRNGGDEDLALLRTEQTMQTNLSSWFDVSVGSNIFDGSLPSRIYPDLYLGNVMHASNPGMLATLGITHMLSIGENPTGPEMDKYPMERLYIDRVQDDGIDSILPIFKECFDFIDQARHKKGKVLVHCRVGVSRSASVCIAEVMRRDGLSTASAYLLVRARRLNIIIQPNLRFMYDLLRFEESLISANSDRSVLRSISWPHLSREIANLNRFYI